MMTFGQAVKALQMTYPGTDERLTAKALLEILKQDVIQVVERPGSWEGANMHQVLRCHGFWLKAPD